MADAEMCKKRVEAYLPSGLKEELAAIAKANGLKLSPYLSKVLTEHVLAMQGQK